MDITPKNLLKRVYRFAREELARRSASDSQAQEDSVAASEATNEARGPARERSTDVRTRAREAAAGTRERSQSGIVAQASAVADDGSLDAGVHGLEVVRPHGGGLLTLRWAVTSAEVARAQTLITGNPVLCVRLVNFTKARDDVLREVQDRPGVELSGQCEIGEPAQRAVVSLGLRSGDRFVSIHHHVI